LREMTMGSRIFHGFLKVSRAHQFERLMKGAFPAQETSFSTGEKRVRCVANGLVLSPGLKRFAVKHPHGMPFFLAHPFQTTWLQARDRAFGENHFFFCVRRNKKGEKKRRKKCGRNGGSYAWLAKRMCVGLITMEPCGRHNCLGTRQIF